MDILQGEVVQAAADHELQKKAFEQFLSENKTALEELGVNPEEFVDLRTLQEVVKKASDPESMSDAETKMFEKVKDLLPTNNLPPAGEAAIRQDIAA